MQNSEIELLQEKFEDIANLFKSLSHPKRLLILCFLSQGEYQVNELEGLCEISQSQLSQFLRRMELEGILESRKDGRNILYTLKDEKVSKLIISLSEIFSAKCK